MTRRARATVVGACAAAMVLAAGLPAAADHTDPNEPQSQPTEGVAGQPGDPRGEGEWEHLFHAPPNPGSDHHYFTKNGEVYVSHGTLGQGGLFGDIPPGNHVGQRIIRLLDDQGELDPEWVADHGSAACIPGDPAGTLGLQHDVWSTPPDDPELLVDATDATGRCHDTPTGGIEIIDISGLGEDDFEVREVHLTRFASTSHTLTVDDARPWIVWSNNSATDAYWMDFIDIRSCLTEDAGGTLANDADLDTKRDECRPEGYRIPFEQEWTMRTGDGEPPLTGPGNGCHDVTSVGTTIYCSGVDADVIVETAGMVDDNGEVLGEPLPCEVVEAEPMDGLETGAMVTDCQLGGEHPHPDDEWEAWEDAGSPQAEGWEHLGHFNHPGREDGNNNLTVPADEGVAISHQTMPLNVPSEFGEFMVVSDERGGAVLPDGASCGDPEFDEFWHGGLHFFDITDPGAIRYATTVRDDEERRAVWRGEIHHPQPTMCVVHLFHHVSPDEQRLVMGYYRQGIKILDYRVNEDGHFEFDEVASFMFPGPDPARSNVWTANVFNVVDNDDGTRTYFIGSSDIQRGFDVFSWTHEPHPIQDPPVVRRLAGPTRIETAVEISRATYLQGDDTDTVVLSRDGDYADALAGGPLAADLDAPILLTASDELSDATQEEIDRIDPERIVLLGGEAAIGPAVELELQLRYPGAQIDRFGGDDRFETAAEIAEELDATGTAFVTEGIHADAERGWPDAVSASPYASFAGQPILLASHDEVPDATTTALDDLEVTETVVVGGPAAVSDAVVDELADAGHGPRRVWGDDRYETSVAVVDEAVDAGMTIETTWLSTGLNWPDALAAGPAVAVAGDVLALVHGEDLDRSTATRAFLEANFAEIDTVSVLGGHRAISPEVAGATAETVTTGPQAQQDGEARSEARGEASADGGVAATSLGLGDTALLLALFLLPAVAILRRRRSHS